jgi:hypothetical protein
LRIVRLTALAALLSAATVGTVAAENNAGDGQDKKHDHAVCIGISTASFETITFANENCVGGARLNEKDSDSLRPDGERGDDSDT